MRSAALLVWLAALSSTALGAFPAHALTITASASGSASPATIPAPGVISNGDFTIADGSPPGPSLVGDGGNEVTTWTFDFSGEAGLAAVEAAGVASALLTLTLNNYETSTDLVGVQELALLGPAELQGLGAGSSDTIQIELIGAGRYTSAEILGELTAGLLAMHYEDDAILSFARLDLVAVPEPGAWLLLSLGLAGFVGSRAASGADR